MPFQSSPVLFFFLFSFFFRSHRGFGLVLLDWGGEREGETWKGAREKPLALCYCFPLHRSSAGTTHPQKGYLVGGLGKIVGGKAIYK